MSASSKPGITRRDLIKTSGQFAAAAALTNALLPGLYAGESNTIQFALVGCGGRGTGAAANALYTKSGPTKLVAMADVFPKKLADSFSTLKTQDGGALTAQLDVPEDRKFVGFDGYKKAMDCLKPGDVVLLTTPPAFRWVQFSYAISKGLNVFMEKPTTVDGPSTRKMLDLAAESVKRGLKVGVGLMCRHCKARAELYDRIKMGEIGDIVLMRAYRLARGQTAKEFTKKKPPDMPSELLYQIQMFHSFLWASGGAYSDFLIHNIDECCWMKDAWPVEAKGFGGRHFRGDNVDQNFDTYAIEYTFADGSKFQLDGRGVDGAYSEFASYAHGSKNSAVISKSGHSPANCAIYKGQKVLSKRDMIWEFGQKEPNPYQLEWDALIEAIRQDKPHNEAERGAKASLVTAMGRMAAHTAQVVTYDDILNCDHEFAPDVDKLTLDGPAPLIADSEGKYPVPVPGLKKREY
ncbi:MAG: Gfo/Idh/MocA family oxidoreductase [Planctomycetia bacterium]|nr:Gfo/Idh/MocA family oxidoreductase [Planctomycetia bacterium]